MTDTEDEPKSAPKFVVPRPEGMPKPPSLRPPSSHPELRPSFKPSRPPPPRPSKPVVETVFDDADELELLQDDEEDTQTINASAVLNAAGMTLLTEDEPDEQDQTLVTASTFFAEPSQPSNLQPSSPSEATSSPPPDAEAEALPPPQPQPTTDATVLEDAGEPLNEVFDDKTAADAGGVNDPFPTEVAEQRALAETGVRLPPAPPPPPPKPPTLPSALGASLPPPPIYPMAAPAPPRDVSFETTAESRELSALAEASVPPPPAVGFLGADTDDSSDAPGGPSYSPPVPSPPREPGQVQESEFTSDMPTQLSAPPPSPYRLAQDQQVSPGLPSKSRSAWLTALIVLFGCAAAGFFVLNPSSPGKLVITVAAPGGLAVSDVEIELDDKPACSASPCTLQGLTAGTHFVSAHVPDYPPIAKQAVLLEAGKDAVFNLQLKAKPRGSVVVTSQVQGLVVSIDGGEPADLPLKVELEPGKHVLEAVGEGLERHTETFELAPGEHREVGPLLPQLIEGTLTVDSDGPVEATLDGDTIRIPFSRKLDAKVPHVLVARRANHRRFIREVLFTAKEPEVAIQISMERLDKSDVPEDDSPSQDSPPQDSEPQATNTKTPPEAAADLPSRSDDARGTLNLDSVPPTTILLDGTPLGRTPKRGISIKPGTHSVTFIHPKRGRKTLRVTVGAGDTKTLKPKL